MFSKVNIALCLLVVLSAGVFQSEAFAIPRNDSLPGGPCRNFTIGNILEMTEQLRARMHMYLPIFSIPPLDPLELDELNLNGNVSQFLEGINVRLYNNTVVGISGFEINDLDFNMLGFGVDLQLVIPTFNIFGQHESTGSLFGIVAVEGEGDFNLTVHNVTFDISGRLNFTGTEWDVPVLAINFTIGAITGGLENLSDSFFNDLLNLSGPELIELGWPEMEPRILELVSDICTTFLNNFTIEELMGILFGAEFDWPEIIPRP